MKSYHKEFVYVQSKHLRVYVQIEFSEQGNVSGDLAFGRRI